MVIWKKCTEIKIESEDNNNGMPVKTKLKKFSNLLWKVFVWVLIIGSLHYVRRIFVAERFFIPSESMKPTLEPGDHVWVNKLLFGARIYKSFNFEDHAPLRCIRMPGLRKIKPGDVICFNAPLGFDQWTVIEFKINYVYCKRVVGTPGDIIGVKDGVTWNNNYQGIIGVFVNQLAIHVIPDSVVWRMPHMATMPYTRPIWNQKDFGPLYIPEKGITIELDSIGRAIYGPVIEYETGSWPDDEITSYTFQHDYYFAFGDYTMYSQDSRHWGFIPEDFIIGIVGGKKVRNNPNQTN